MPRIELRLPLPRIQISVSHRVVSFELPRPRLSWLAPSRALRLSLVAHALFFFAIAGLNWWEAYARANRSTEVEVEYLAMPSGYAARGTGQTAAQHERIAIARKGAREQAHASVSFESLLSSALSGVQKNARSGGVLVQSASAQPAKVAQRLRDDLLAAAAAQAVAGAPGPARALSIPWSQLEPARSDGSEPKLGSVEKEAIRKVIALREQGLRRCHERALLVDGALAGQAELLITVADAGHVSQVGIAFDGVGSSTSREALQKCVSDTLTGVAFPAAAAGHEIKFSLLLR